MVTVGSHIGALYDRLKHSVEDADTLSPSQVVIFLAHCFKILAVLVPRKLSNAAPNCRAEVTWFEMVGVMHLVLIFLQELAHDLKGLHLSEQRGSIVSTISVANIFMHSSLTVTRTLGPSSFTSRENFSTASFTTEVVKPGCIVPR